MHKVVEKQKNKRKCFLSPSPEFLNCYQLFFLSSITTYRRSKTSIVSNPFSSRTKFKVIRDFLTKFLKFLFLHTITDDIHIGFTEF